MLKPRALQLGDTIGVISPSWGGAGLFPHRCEAGRRQLEAMGFKLRFAQHALSTKGYVSDSAEHRASDVHELFADPGVAAIIAAIGGDHSCHLLPHLDFELIRAHPKVFMGFSDVTVLNVALWQQTGLVTFNGPALLADFAEHPRMFEYSERYFRKVACTAAAPGALEPASTWTEEMLSWEQRADLERPRELNASEGWTWLKPGRSEGILIGGCVESLQHLRGTRFWPDFSGAILFLETSEDKPSPETIDGVLMDYENMGVLAQLNGMIVGRPMLYTPEEKRELRRILIERTYGFDFPIVCDMDFGHTAPQLTLPIGIRARIDSTARSFEIIEAATS
jgi:muramoyltetrapeptide carboxypeptidase LdcA involved in peptidoglycan recycling